MQDIVQTHRDAVLKATEDFDVVGELKSLYRMSVASGSLAVAHNALGTLGRLQNLEPARRVEVRTSILMRSTDRSSFTRPLLIRLELE